MAQYEITIKKLVREDQPSLIPFAKPKPFLDEEIIYTQVVDSLDVPKVIAAVNERKT